jgi:hypothetical protein
VGIQNSACGEQNWLGRREKGVEEIGRGDVPLKPRELQRCRGPCNGATAAGMPDGGRLGRRWSHRCRDAGGRTFKSSMPDTSILHHYFVS